MEKISVIIPVYNSEKYLSKCLESVLKQTYKNIEIILIDDGSTDESGLICDDYSNKDERIRVIHTENVGVSHARNVGLENATGDLISFIDSDDELENNMFEVLVNIKQKYNADMSHCGYKRVDEFGNFIKNVCGTHAVLIQDNVETITNMLGGVYFTGGLWNKLYSYSVVKNIRFAEELKNNEDILFNVLAIQNCRKIVFIDECKYIYYEHTLSACNTINKEKQIADSLKATELMMKNCCNEKLRKIYFQRYFSQKLNLYKNIVAEGNSKADRKSLKEWIKRNHEGMLNGFKSKLNYMILMYFPHIYILIYKLYTLIRKPNWDAKSS